MDSIYKTKWGAYVDLSKILSIQKADPMFSIEDVCVHFQLHENPVYYSLLVPPKSDNTENKEAYIEDLVKAWQDYNSECVIHYSNAESQDESITQQLEKDRRIYGLSFERVNCDGTRERLDPLTVQIRT